MKIPFEKNSLGFFATNVRVEIPEHIMNRFPFSFNSIDDNSTTMKGEINIPGIEAGRATLKFGSPEIIFSEEDDRLHIPPAQSLGIHISQPVDEGEQILLKLGFIKRGEGHYYHTLLTADNATYWLRYDSKTDDLGALTVKIAGMGYREARARIKASIKMVYDNI